MGFSLQRLILLQSPGSRARAWEVWCTGLSAPQHVGFSQTMDWTRVPCTVRGILYHWTTRKTLQLSSDEELENPYPLILEERWGRQIDVQTRKILKGKKKKKKENPKTVCVHCFNNPVLPASCQSKTKYDYTDPRLQQKKLTNTYTTKFQKAHLKILTSIRRTESLNKMHFLFTYQTISSLSVSKCWYTRLFYTDSLTSYKLQEKGMLITSLDVIKELIPV